ncbi:hypothetical protein RCL94_18180, partial [Escherichia coli]|nr:hypothetical protein [Escherichia coli]MED9087647.1 hypothetical protein [Escherichia coli]MED9407482.1 hypothetical protein [Escherichia coli]
LPTLFTIVVILVTDAGVAAELGMEIGKLKSESGKAALKTLSANMDTHADVLRKQGDSVSRSVILSVERMQSVQQRKLVLQMKIDELRSTGGDFYVCSFFCAEKLPTIRAINTRE